MENKVAPPLFTSWIRYSASDHSNYFTRSFPWPYKNILNYSCMAMIEAKHGHWHCKKNLQPYSQTMHFGYVEVQ